MKENIGYGGKDVEEEQDIPRNKNGAVWEIGVANST